MKCCTLGASGGKSNGPRGLQLVALPLICPTFPSWGPSGTTLLAGISLGPRSCPEWGVNQQIVPHRPGRASIFASCHVAMLASCCCLFHQLRLVHRRESRPQTRLSVLSFPPRSGGQRPISSIQWHRAMRPNESCLVPPSGSSWEEFHGWWQLCLHPWKSLAVDWFGAVVLLSLHSGDCCFRSSLL